MDPKKRLNFNVIRKLSLNLMLWRSANGQTRTWLNNLNKLWSYQSKQSGKLNLLLSIFGCTLFRNMFMTTLSKLWWGKGKEKSKRKCPAFPSAVLAFCFLNRKARVTRWSRMSQVTKAEQWNPTHMLGTCFL